MYNKNLGCQFPESISLQYSTLDRMCKDYYSVCVGYPTRSRNMQTLAEYDATVDTKKRITLRGRKYSHYHVAELEDGRIILEPRVLVSPFEVSTNTLSMMDSSIENFKHGKTSKPVDLSSFPLD
jgi:hypothetical protein